MARRASRSTAASTTGCARWSRCRRYHVPAGRAGRRRAGGARSSAMRSGPTRTPRLAIEGRTLIARSARGQRRLVRLRRAVRRAALAARLPRARAALRRDVRCPASRAMTRRDGRPRAALHLARRHPVRSPREAPRSRPPSPPERPVRRRSATARSSRAPSAGSSKCAPATTWRCRTSPRRERRVTRRRCRLHPIARSAPTNPPKETPMHEIQGLPDVRGQQGRVEPLRRHDARRARSGRRRRQDQVLDDQLQGRAVVQRRRQDHAQVPDQRRHRHGGHRRDRPATRAGSTATR